MHLLFKEWKDGEALQKGKYDIKMDVDQPYYKKIANLSKEPVAFCLYKSRHFEKKSFY